MCLSLFSRSVQKQPTRSESRPKVMRPLGATNDAFGDCRLADAHELTRRVPRVDHVVEVLIAVHRAPYMMRQDRRGGEQHGRA